MQAIYAVKAQARTPEATFAHANTANEYRRAHVFGTVVETGAVCTSPTRAKGNEMHARKRTKEHDTRTTVKVVGWDAGRRRPSGSHVSVCVLDTRAAIQLREPQSVKSDERRLPILGAGYATV